MNSADHSKDLRNYLFMGGHFALKVPNVTRWEGLAEDLVDNGNKIVKRTDDRKGLTVTVEAICDNKEHRRSQGIEGNMAAKEIGGELTIGPAEPARRMRQSSIKVTDSAKVGLFSHDFFLRRAAISISLSRTR